MGTLGKQKRASNPPGAGVTGNREPPHTGSLNQTQALGKSSKRCQPLSHPSLQPPKFLFHDLYKSKVRLSTVLSRHTGESCSASHPCRLSPFPDVSEHGRRCPTGAPSHLPKQAACQQRGRLRAAITTGSGEDSQRKKLVRPWTPPPLDRL